MSYTESRPPGGSSRAAGNSVGGMFVEWAGKLISKRVSMQLIIDAMLVVEVAIVTLTATLAELLYPLLPLAESQLREEQYFIVGLSGGVLSLLIMRNQKLTNYAAIAKGGKIWRELLISLVMGVMLVIAAGFALKISRGPRRTEWVRSGLLSGRRAA